MTEMKVSRNMYKIRLDLSLLETKLQWNSSLLPVFWSFSSLAKQVSRVPDYQQSSELHILFY